MILEKFTVTIFQFLQIWKITGEILCAAVKVINSVVYSCNASECSPLYQKILDKFSSFPPTRMLRSVGCFFIDVPICNYENFCDSFNHKQVAVFATSHSRVM